jgi:hypothetical protein
MTGLGVPVVIGIERQGIRHCRMIISAALLAGQATDIHAGITNRHVAYSEAAALPAVRQVKPLVFEIYFAMLIYAAATIIMFYPEQVIASPEVLDYSSTRAQLPIVTGRALILVKSRAKVNIIPLIQPDDPYPGTRIHWYRARHSHVNGRP